jgi:hypothetical protein
LTGLLDGCTAPEENGPMPYHLKNKYIFLNPSCMQQTGFSLHDTIPYYRPGRVNEVEGGSRLIYLTASIRVEMWCDVLLYVMVYIRPLPPPTLFTLK